MKNKWYDNQHYIIVNTITNRWIQQSYTSKPEDVNSLNDHEITNGRESVYQEKYFTSEQIQAYNKLEQ